jgi:hypothetical protein
MDPDEKKVIKTKKELNDLSDQLIKVINGFEKETLERLRQKEH